MGGERRIMTILFFDVKGSTAAAEQIDPEDWTAAINGAFEHMIRPVYKYEDSVARLMGNAILAFFGVPIAHEDDPRRAALAGLDILASMKPYRPAASQRIVGHRHQCTGWHEYRPRRPWRRGLRPAHGVYRHGGCH